MKNIHVLPTDKPSRLHESGLFSSLGLSKEYLQWKFGKNIFITSDEEIKEGDWCLDLMNNTIYVATKVVVHNLKSLEYEQYLKKITLTTDQDLIADGVQPIHDEFLEWFVKNPSCEEVEVKPMLSNNGRAFYGYKIIIPKEELKIQCKDCHNSLINCTCIEDTIDMKQETLEQAAEKYALSKDSSSIFIKVHKKDFINGAKWQAERSYSEEEVQVKLYECLGHFAQKHNIIINGSEIDQWFEQFKKK